MVAVAANQTRPLSAALPNAHAHFGLHTVYAYDVDSGHDCNRFPVSTKYSAGAMAASADSALCKVEVVNRAGHT